jgi:S-adenosylmethionine decarboxylase
MAYLDTLFQLGMDLTRSSTAQKEDHVATARVARTSRPVHRTHEDRTEDLTKRESVRPAGRHLLIDLHDANRLDDASHVERTLERCIEVVGATALHIHVYRTSSMGGVSGVAVLSEGHIGVHSWPAAGYAAFDVFLAKGVDIRRIIDLLREAFSADGVTVREHERGAAAPSKMKWQAAEPRKAPARMRKAKAA